MGTALGTLTETRSGHAYVFLSGTTTSISGPLTFGPLEFPGAALEPGVVLAQDAAGNVLEITWPSLAGGAESGLAKRPTAARARIRIPEAVPRTMNHVKIDGIASEFVFTRSEPGAAEVNPVCRRYTESHPRAAHG